MTTTHSRRRRFTRRPAVRVQPVRNEQDRSEALHRLNKLMDKKSLTEVEQDELEILAIIVQAYEQRTFGAPNVSPRSLLRSLIRDGGHKQKDIAAGTGIHESTISEILSGKRQINARQAAAFGRYFGLRAEGFLILN